MPAAQTSGGSEEDLDVVRRRIETVVFGAPDRLYDHRSHHEEL